MRAGANGPLVGTYNRRVVLEAIRVAGATTRVALAEATGLRAQTVSNIVRRLLDEGLVVEDGRQATTIGKPRTVVRINPTSHYAVGVQIDPYGVRLVVVDLDGTIHAHADRPLPDAHKPDDAVRLVAGQVRRVLKAVGVPPERVSGLGVAAPGPIDLADGMLVHPPNLPGWKRFALRDALAAACRLPVTVDNDATAAAIGEHWSGAASGVRNFVFVYMGTGVGAGIFVDGRVYRGASGNAGEFGHVPVSLDGPRCRCGSVGCVEAVSAPAAIVRKRAQPRDVMAAYREVCAAAAAGDTRARGRIETAAGHLATATVGLVNLLDLEMVVLGGPSLDGAAEIYRSAIESAVHERTIARACQQIRVAVSTRGQDAGALGAASLVFYGAFVPGLAGLPSLAGA
jgi:predicted NBD/HSP70 family sugar kinase